jgi:rhodanese-related sulfurtransferase
MKRIILFIFSFITGLFACHSQDAQTAGYTDLDVAAFKAKMADPGIVLLDVRTPEETAQGKIEGTITLDFKNPNFAAEVEKLDKSKTYLVYCRSGNRSGKACKLMAEKGFTNLFNLAGGYLAWTGK